MTRTPLQGQKVNLQGAGHILAASHTACSKHIVLAYLSLICGRAGFFKID